MDKVLKENVNKILEYYPSISQIDAERLAGLRLLDDDFLKMALADQIPAAEYILKTILGKNDLSIVSIKPQHEIKNVFMHSVILDVDAEDSAGNRYDIEIQRADRGAVIQRARYNSAMVDTTMLKPSENYKNLRESYIIFITENDFLKKGLPMYHIERLIQETGELFNDGSHIIYVNGEYNGNDTIGDLMYDFRCSDPKDMKSSLLSQISLYFKNTKEGVQTMCRVFEEARNEAATEATAKATAETSLRVALDLYLSGNISKEVAIKTSLLTEDEFEQQLKKIQA